MYTEVYYPDPERKNVHLDCYLAKPSPEMPNFVRAAMLVLPGGAYMMTSDREADPIARVYFARGMQVFVLRYSVGADAVYPRPLVEASLAVKYIRDNAERFGIDPHRVYAVGFSAGGHLCAALGTFWNADFLRDALLKPGLPAVAEGETRPDATILSYPVITSGVYGHKGSFQTILGKSDPSEEEYDLYSIEKHVHEGTSPAFLWHTANDALVPVQNSLLMAAALSGHRIPFEMHIFPDGPHGISLATAETAYGQAVLQNAHIASWVDMSCEFLKKLEEMKRV